MGYEIQCFRETCNKVIEDGEWRVHPRSRAGKKWIWDCKAKKFHECNTPSGEPKEYHLGSSRDICHNCNTPVDYYCPSCGKVSVVDAK